MVIHNIQRFTYHGLLSHDLQTSNYYPRLPLSSHKDKLPIHPGFISAENWLNTIKLRKFLVVTVDI